MTKEQQVTSLAFNLGVVGDVHDNELTGLFVFDPNRVAVAGQNQPRDFDFFACGHVRSACRSCVGQRFQQNDREYAAERGTYLPGNI